MARAAGHGPLRIPCPAAAFRRLLGVLAGASASDGGLGALEDLSHGDAAGGPAARRSRGGDGGGATVVQSRRQGGAEPRARGGAWGRWWRCGAPGGSEVVGRTTTGRAEWSSQRGSSQVQAGTGVNTRDTGDAERRALGKDAKRSSLNTKLG